MFQNSTSKPPSGGAEPQQQAQNPTKVQIIHV